MRNNVDYAYLGNGVGVTKTHRGHRIFVYTHDLGLTPHIVADGVWEAAIEQAVLKLVSPGDTVIEVGCNMGYHTLAICNKLGPAGCLHGFEANPELFRLLRWSVDHNGFQPRTRLYNHAVTQVAGDVQFTFDPEAVGGGHVLSGGDQVGRLLTVPGRPLDEVLPDLRNVALLRMDVEGFEPFVIRGARGILDRSPGIRIVAEWSVAMMGSRLHLPHFIDEMTAMGFHAWVIDESSRFITVPMDALLTLPHCEVAFSRADLSLLNHRRSGAFRRLLGYMTRQKQHASLESAQTISTIAHTERLSNPPPEPDAAWVKIEAEVKDKLMTEFQLPPKRDNMVCKLCGSHATLAFGLPYNKKTSHPIPQEPDDCWYYQCDTCHFLFTDAIDYHTSHGEIYDDTYWENQDPDWYGRVTETFRLVALANELLNIRLDRAEILDFGCGIGGFVEMGRRSLNLNVWGTDIIPPKVGKEYFLTDLGDRKFDIITSCEVIEHLPNPRAIFDKIKAHLKPRGVFAFQTAEWDPGLGRDWWYLGPNNGHISLYSRDGLSHVFQDMGGAQRRLWNDYPGVQAWLFHAD